MTQPQRQPVQVVADAANANVSTHNTDAGVEYIDGRDEWRAQSVIKQWAPEHQLIGALMHLSADNARAILELVPDTAIWRPITRRAIEVIRAMVAGPRPRPGCRAAYRQNPAVNRTFHE